MQRILVLPALALVLAATADAQALAPAPESFDTVLDRPFARMVDTGADGYVVSAYDASHFAALRAAHDVGLPVQLVDFPLPGGRDVTLRLRPIDVWEEGGTARVMTAAHKEIRVAPTARLFTGSIPGETSRVFLGVTATMAHGYVSLGDERYYLSTGPSGSVLAISDSGLFTGGIRHHGELDEHGHPKGLETIEEPFLEPYDAGANDGGLERSAGAPLLRTSQIFIDCDYRIRSRFKTDQDMIDYATILTAVTSAINRRDIGLLIEIPNGYVRVWNYDDPWAGTVGGYEKWFNSPSNPAYGIPRTLVHKLSKYPRPSSARGPYACDPTKAFAYSGVQGHFPWPVQHTSPDNLDLYLFGQESGHVFGSVHTFQYWPPIDCDDGSGPDKGTIMSYCNVADIGMRFHERVQNSFRAYLANRSCLSPRPLMLGDYDGNGYIDPADLLELDAFMNQGFVSLAAHDVFDVNLDSVVDTLDRALMVGMMIAPATTTLFNGSGTNCLCFGAVTQPILGADWTSVVGGASGPGVLTAVLVAPTQLVPPTVTPYGEVMIAINGFGGQTLFTSLATTTGTSATHTNAIADDAAWAGTTLYAQGAVLDPSGLLLTNGLTLHVSSY